MAQDMTKTRAATKRHFKLCQLYYTIRMSCLTELFPKLQFNCCLSAREWNCHMQHLHLQINLSVSLYYQLSSLYQSSQLSFCHRMFKLWIWESACVWLCCNCSVIVFMWLSSLFHTHNMKEFLFLVYTQCANTPDVEPYLHWLIRTQDEPSPSSHSRNVIYQLFCGWTVTGRPAFELQMSVNKYP